MTCGEMEGQHNIEAMEGYNGRKLCMDISGFYLINPDAKHRKHLSKNKLEVFVKN